MVKKRSKKRTKKNNNIIAILITIILAIILGVGGINSKDISVEDVTGKEKNEILEANANSIDKIVLENSSSENVIKIYFFDQTTPNMIQGLKGVFARKPLISRGI